MDNETDFLEPEQGASMIEYVFLALLIVVVCIAAMTSIGLTTSEMFSSAGSGFSGNG